MGSTGFSGFSHVSKDAYDELYNKRVRTSGVKSFTHDNDVRTGKTSAAAHARVDPSKIKDSVVGKRESRDVDGKPSNAIAVMFDVTGSMGGIPKVLQSKLVKLMPTLLTRGIIDNPQVLFGAIGDARSDRVPFQVGQFESDLAMDEDLDKFYLEGGGGGSSQESYELGLLFLSRLTALDCLEKRGKRGYAFFIGDEQGYPTVNRNQVTRIFGDSCGLQEDMTIEDIVEEAKKQYEVFFIVPNCAASYYKDKFKTYWQQYFGQNVLVLDDPDLVCETIATAIGLAEGTIEDANDLAGDLDMTNNNVASVSRAVSEYKSNRSLSDVKVSGDLVTSTDSGLA